MRVFIKLAVLSILAIATIPAVTAQPSDAYELSCPSGYDPMPAYGKTFNSQTGRWRANMCIANDGSGRMLCQADGCGGSAVNFGTLAGGTSNGKTFTLGSSVFNISGTGGFDFSAGNVLSALKLPIAPGAAPITAGVVAYDSMANQPVVGNGSSSEKLIPLVGLTPSSGNCVKFSVTGTQVGVQDTGAACVAPSAIPTQVVQSGLIGEYRLTEGSGTTITDFSGNGNTGTFGGGAANPTWISPSGLQFSGAQFVGLPAALNGARTMQFIASFQYTGAGTYNALIGPPGPTTPNCPTLMLDNRQAINPGVNYIFETWGTGFAAQKRWTLQGEGIVTWEIATAGNDQIQVNGSNLVNMNGFTGVLSANNYQLGGATGTGGNCPGVVRYYVGNIYYAVFYNRLLTQGEVNLNNEFLTQVMLARGQSVQLQSTSTTDLLVLDGDSEMGLNPAVEMTIAAPINVYNTSTGGLTIEALSSDAPFAVDPYFQLAANREAVVIWGGTNDYGGSMQTTLNYISTYCKARHKVGFACGVVSLMDKTSFDTNKNSIDTLLRQNWPTFADFFADVGADPNLGCDGCAANTTYMSGGLHATTAAQYNIVAPIVQRAVNRYYGNNDWSSATTYVAAAPAATAITAASEVGNTVTITSTLNPPVNSCVVIAGVTPAAYNNVSGECWNVLTTSGTTFTYYHFQTGLTAGTVFGTASVPLQKDADVFTILNFGAGNFTLQPCGGYTGQKLYIKNTNAAASTVVAFGNDLIDGAASVSVAQNAVLVLQAKLPNPSTPQCAWVKVQNN